MNGMFELTLLPVHAAVFWVVLAIELRGELPDWGVALGSVCLVTGASWLLAHLLPEGWSVFAWAIAFAAGIVAVRLNTRATLKESCAAVSWYAGVVVALGLIR